MADVKLIFNGNEITVHESDVEWFINEKGAKKVGGSAPKKPAAKKPAVKKEEPKEDK
jgi:hypothetical protein